MVEIPETATNLLGYFRFGLNKFREILMWIAGFIGKYIEFPQENIYNILVILVAVWLASKIFYFRQVTIKGRWLEFVLIAFIVYFILKVI